MQSIEEVRANRPQEPAVARILLVMAVVLWAPVIGQIHSDTTGGVLGLVLFLVVFGSFGAVKGRRAGRTMATVAVAIVYLFLLPFCALGFYYPIPYGVIYAAMDVVAVILSVIGLCQLFHPKASRYIHRVTVMMRSR
jgi:hypothetical protein